MEIVDKPYESPFTDEELDELGKVIWPERG